MNVEEVKQMLKDIMSANNMWYKWKKYLSDKSLENYKDNQKLFYKVIKNSRKDKTRDTFSIKNKEVFYKIKVRGK